MLSRKAAKLREGKLMFKEIKRNDVKQKKILVKSRKRNTAENNK